MCIKFPASDDHTQLFLVFFFHQHLQDEPPFFVNIGRGKFSCDIKTPGAARKKFVLKIDESQRKSTRLVYYAYDTKDLDTATSR